MAIPFIRQWIAPLLTQIMSYNANYIIKWFVLIKSIMLGWKSWEILNTVKNLVGFYCENFAK